eukprot:11169013-Lingulodinium_polyedra.AAC.1
MLSAVGRFGALSSYGQACAHGGTGTMPCCTNIIPATPFCTGYCRRGGKESAWRITCVRRAINEVVLCGTT